ARGSRPRMDSPSRPAGPPTRRRDGGDPRALRRCDCPGTRAGYRCLSAPDGTVGPLGCRADGRVARPAASAAPSAVDVAVRPAGDPLSARAGERLVQGPARARPLWRYRRPLDPALGEDTDFRRRTDARHRRPRRWLAAAARRIAEDHRRPGVVPALA